MARAAGIIAEYNPFHNGHAYQIRKAKELTGAEYCVVVLSGDFVQRGAPALYDKYTRTRMALLNGADLVLEMPPVFAVSSAEDFAACGIALLDRLGVVEAVCFGSECGRIAPLMEIARVLCADPPEYEAALAENLRGGLSFPRARAEALARYGQISRRDTVPTADPSPRPDGKRSFSGRPPFHGEETPPSQQPAPGEGTLPAQRPLSGKEALPGQPPPDGLLAFPNNILGVEYCKALIRRGSSMEPVTLRRQGDGYHETAWEKATPSPDPSCPDRAFPSAAALRRILSRTDADTPPSAFLPLSSGIPASALALIRGAVPVLADDFSAILSQRLLDAQLNHTPLTDFLDVSGDLAARIRRQTLEFSGFEERAASLKTRQYTYSRVSRALTHILLGITVRESESRKSGDYVSYVRVLGLRKSAGPLLSAIKKHTQKTTPLPVVTKTADTASLLGGAAMRDFRRDLYVSHLYQAVLAAKSGRKVPNEYTASVVTVP